MTDWKRKQEAKRKAAKELEATKKRLRICRPGGAAVGVVPDPLVSAPYYRQGNTIPTSDRIPGYASKKDIMTEHKWKSREKKETIQEIYRKASRIAPAYNKGALQFLPPEFDKLESKKKA